LIAFLNNQTFHDHVSLKVLFPVLVLATIILTFGTVHAQQDSSIPSPLKQLKSGTALADIKCKESFVLVIKSDNGNPACVNPNNIARFLSSGWVTLEKYAITHDTIHGQTNATQYQNKTNDIHEQKTSIENNSSIQLNPILSNMSSTNVTGNSKNVTSTIPVSAIQSQDCDAIVKHAYFKFINGVNQNQGLDLATQDNNVKTLLKDDHLDTGVYFFSIDANYTYDHVTCSNLTFNSVEYLFAQRNSNDGFIQFVRVSEDPSETHVIDIKISSWDDVANTVYSHPSDYDYISKLYQLSTIGEGDVLQLAQGQTKPLPVVPINFTVSSNHPDTIKILMIGMSPYPLKVGDMPVITMTYQNISNKTMYQTFGQIYSPIFLTILPSDDVVGAALSPYHSMGNVIHSHNPISPNQINTNQAYFDPSARAVDLNTHNVGFNAGFYHILKPGPLQVTLDLYLDGEGSDVIREKVQFNLTATS
jgi:hypothetical protein